MLKFRPHHFLCTLGFRGKGYSPDFVANFSAIVARLTDQSPIEVVESVDSICTPCPSNRAGRCTDASKIEKLDQAHLEILDLTLGSVLTWGEAKTRIRDRMSVSDFNRACKSCSWKELGVCENALRDLKKN